MNVMAEKTRPAAVAGKFYPAQPSQLGRMIETFPTAPSAAAGNPLSLGERVRVRGNSKALIASHAGYIFSEPISRLDFSNVGASGAVVNAEPELHTRVLSSQGSSAKDWLCAWCLERVANENDRFSCGGQSEFSFKNPAGVLFHIVTFTQTIGCRQAGVPTLEHTWFSGHAWSYCACGRCGIHLGWFYSGPSEFVGLIRNR